MLAPKKVDLGPAVRFEEPRWPGNGGTGGGGGGSPGALQAFLPNGGTVWKNRIIKGAVLKECMVDPPTSQV